MADLYPIIDGHKKPTPNPSNKLLLNKQLKALLRIRREIRKLLSLEELPHRLDNGTILYTHQDVDDRIQFLMRKYLDDGSVD